jgi:aspartate carbamoyltransferase
MSLLPQSPLRSVSKADNSKLQEVLPLEEVNGTVPPMPVVGRTIQAVTDLTLDEQLYLYERTRQLKKKHSNNRVIQEEMAPPLFNVQDPDEDDKVADPDASVYLLFLESSTRTKESLRNAAAFHAVKVNEFSAETSSFKKNETITDTMKMLTVYSTQRSIFVIRSPIEGVCRWLEAALAEHAKRFCVPSPAFINAGDGQNTHPLGEYLDVFSLLEQKNWDRSAIHIAMVGDLAHGRTVHSKVDGLKVFEQVRVDIVAPDVFGYPIEYRNAMRNNGFEVREFDSIESYLETEQGCVADIWYFCQPQYKRVGDLLPSAFSELRSKVTFRPEWRQHLPTDVHFFQTLPRDKVHPVVPLSFDTLPLNGWDRVANNGFFLHTVLLGMLFGKLGRGIPGIPKERRSSLDVENEDHQKSSLPFFGADSTTLPSWIEPIDLCTKDHTRRPERAKSGGSIPLKDGLVIDHIGVSTDPTSCWQRMRRLRTILGWSKLFGNESVYDTGKGNGLMKGIMTLPNFDFQSLAVTQMKVIASIAPDCTVNAITNSAVAGKYRLRMPERIYNLPNISCKNKLCVSHPDNKQRDVVAFFERKPFYETSALPKCKEAKYLFVCKYCLWPHEYENIWS